MTRLLLSPGPRVGAAWVAAALALAAPAAEAAQHQGGNVHQWWSLPSPAYNVDQRLTVRAIADDTFFALVVWFANVTDGAYMGVQQLAGGTRLARFSVWNSTAATAGAGATCRDFGGEGVGKTCELPLAFALDHPYRFRLWRLTADAQGTWWGAWVIDDATADEHFIGQVRAPSPAGDIVAADTFDEYFGEATPCDAVPWSAVDVAAPALDGGSRRVVADPPTSGACSAGRVTASSEWFRLELGSDHAGDLPPLETEAPDAGAGPSPTDAGGAAGEPTGGASFGSCAAGGGAGGGGAGAGAGAALAGLAALAARRRRRR